MKSKIILVVFIQFLPAILFAQKEDFKPRILVGISGVNNSVSGDVRTSNEFIKKLSVGLHGKFQFSKVFSAAIEVAKGSSVGENLAPSQGYINNGSDNHWIKSGYTVEGVIDNYKMSFTKAGLNLGVNTNTDKKVSFGMQAVISMLAFNTKVNTLNAAGQRYDFADFTTSWDDTYETAAESESNTTAVFEFGPNIIFKVGKGFYISLHSAVGITGSDLLDGSQWVARPGQAQAAQTTDKDDLFSYGLSVYYDFKFLK